MGWVEYIINTEKKLAYRISRNTSDLYEDDELLLNLDNFFKYINNEDVSLEVVKYLTTKLDGIEDANELFIKMLFNKGYNERVHEDNLDKSYTIIN